MTTSNHHARDPGIISWAKTEIAQLVEAPTSHLPELLLLVLLLALFGYALIWLAGTVLNVGLRAAVPTGGGASSGGFLALASATVLLFLVRAQVFGLSVQPAIESLLSVVSRITGS